MATKLHSQVVEGSRHAIHNLTYANAANRIAGTGEGSGINPPTALNLYQIAKQDDDNSLWMLVDDSPLTWVQIPISTTGDLDFGYDAFGGAGTVTIDAGTLTWAPSSTYHFLVDVTAANTGYGFVVEQTSSGNQFAITQISGNLNHYFEGTNFSVDASQSLFEGSFFTADVTSGFFIWGQTDSEVQALGATADLLLGARGTNIYLNEAGHTSLVAAYASVSSIIGALNLVAGGSVGGDLDAGYNLFGANPSTIVVDAAEGQGTALTYDLNGERYLDVDTVNGTAPVPNGGLNYKSGFRVKNGADIFGVYRRYADQLDFYGQLYEFQLQSSENYFYLADNLATGSFATWSNGSAAASAVALTASSGTQSFVAIDAPINQSGTASYDALLVDVDVNAEGSGSKNIIHAQYGGATRFRVDKVGTIYGKSSTADGSTNLITLEDSAAAAQFRVDSDGNTRIGTGTPGIATGAGDLYVTDALEVDGIIYPDGGARFGNNVDLLLGNAAGTHSFFEYNTTQTPSALMLALDVGHPAFILCDRGDTGFDFAHGAVSNPTLFGHSANQSTTEWWSLTHNQTDGVLATGAGALSLAPASGVIKYPDAGQVLFDIAPAADHTATGDTHSATVFANATGIGAALYQKSDSQWAEADADAIATMPCRALALETGTGTKLILRRGWIRDDSWSWTPGAPVYVSTTTGGLTQTKPSGTGDQVQIVGYAETADILDFNPSSVIVEVA